MYVTEETGAMFNTSVTTQPLSTTCLPMLTVLPPRTGWLLGWLPTTRAGVTRLPTATFRVSDSSLLSAGILIAHDNKTERKESFQPKFKDVAGFVLRVSLSLDAFMLPLGVPNSVK